jgi:cytosine/adenosine deaminase-related metal-dependent hydrolase
MAPITLLQKGTLLLHQSDNSIRVATETDLLIEGNKIAAIGANLDAPAEATTLDCSGKIISPGFIDTHHHVWQTQLKGRHADQELIAYMASGNMQCFSYEPQDTFWGQLSGALEALDSGTTFILDHSHGSYSAEHAQKAMEATIASGLRSVLALSPTIRVEQWDNQTIKPNMDIWPGYIMDKIGQWCKEGGDAGLAGRVHAGLGFDLFFLPKEMVQGIWAQAQQLGVKLITSHVSRGAISGQHSPVELMQSYGILKGPEKGGVKFVAAHANGFQRSDLDTLASENQYISTTPETEAQMGLGLLNTFEPGAKTSLGIDCHTNNSSSILIQARAALQLKRQETNAKVIEKGGAPRKLRASTTEAFNLATIEGARAVGMEKEIGSLEVGKKADIVIFDYDNSVGMLCAGDYDPLVSVLRHSDVRDIDTVLVDGIIRKQNGKLLDVEVDGSKLSWRDIAKKTRESQVDVLGRLNKLNLQAGEGLLKQMWHIDDNKLFGVD